MAHFLNVRVGKVVVSLSVLLSSSRARRKTAPQPKVWCDPCRGVRGTGELCLERGLWDTGRPPRVSSPAWARGALPGWSTPSSASRGIIEKKTEISSERADAENSRGPPSEATRDSDQTEGELGVRGPQYEGTLCLVNNNKNTVVEGEYSKLATGGTLAVVSDTGKTDTSKTCSERALWARGNSSEVESSYLAGESVRDIPVTENADATPAVMYGDLLGEREMSGIVKEVMDKLREAENSVEVEDGNGKTEQEMEQECGQSGKFGAVVEVETDGKETGVGREKLKKERWSRAQKLQRKIMRVEAALKLEIAKVEQKKQKLEGIALLCETSNEEGDRKDTSVAQEQLNEKRLSGAQRRKMKKMMARAAGERVLTKSEQKKRKLEEVTPNYEIGNREAKKVSSTVQNEAPVLSVPPVYTDRQLRRFQCKLKAKKFKTNTDGGKAPVLSVPPVSTKKCVKRLKRKLKSGKPHATTKTVTKFVSGGITGGDANASATEEVTGGNAYAPVTEQVNKRRKNVLSQTAAVGGTKQRVTAGQKRKYKRQKQRDITKTFIKFLSGGFTGGNDNAPVTEKVDEYSTGVSDREAEGEEETAGSMRVAVVPVGFPDVKMTEEQAEMVWAALTNMIDPSESEELVQFSAMQYENGGLAITCTDRPTKVWLRKTVSKLVPWIGACLTVGQADLTLKGTKLVLSLPKAMKGRSDKEVLDLFQKQNKGISTAKWKVRSRLTEADERERLTLWVDEKSFQDLKARDFKLFLDLSIVYLLQWSQWENLPADSRVTVWHDLQPVVQNLPLAQTRYKPLRPVETELSSQNFPLPLVPVLQTWAVDRSLSPTVPGVGPNLPDFRFEDQGRPQCRERLFANKDHPHFREAQFVVSGQLLPQEHMFTVPAALQNHESRFLAKEQRWEFGFKTSEHLQLQEVSYMILKRSQHRHTKDNLDRDQENRYFTSDHRHSREIGYGEPEPLQLHQSRYMDLDRLSPRDERDTDWDRLSPLYKTDTVWDRLSSQDKIPTVWDRLSPRGKKYMASDGLSPQGKRYKASSWVSPQDNRCKTSSRVSLRGKRYKASDSLTSRDKRCKYSNWLSSHDERHMPSDRLSPQDGKYTPLDHMSHRNGRHVVSDQRSPRDRRYTASDQLSTRDGRYAASDRLSPRDRRYAVSDRLSPQDGRDVASDWLLPRDGRDVASDRLLPRDGRDVASDRLLPRDGRDVASDRLLPRDGRDVASDRLLPRDGRDVASDRLLPRDGRDVASDRLLPRDGRDVASDRLLPRDGRDVASDRLLPRDGRDVASDRLLPRDGRDVASDRLLPRDGRDVASDRLLPRDGRDVASDRLLPRDGRDVASDRLLPRDGRDVASDRLLPRDGRDVASDRLLPRDGRDVASDRLLPRDGRDVASDRLLPRDGRDVASDRLLPRDGRDVASDRLLPRDGRDVASDRLLPRDGRDVASDRLLPRDGRDVASDRLSPQDRRYTASDRLSTRDSRYADSYRLSSQESRYAVSDRLSPRDRRYDALDQLSTQYSRYTDSERLSPRYERYTASHQLSPGDSRYAALDQLLLRDLRYAASDRLSPRDSRYATSDRLSPQDSRYATSDRLLPQDSTCAASDRLSPRDSRCAASDRLSPRDSRCAASDSRYEGYDRQSLRDKSYTASDWSSSCDPRHKVSEQPPSRDWYPPSNQSLSSCSGHITPIQEKSPNSKWRRSVQQSSSDYNSVGPHESLFEESTFRGRNQVQYNEGKFVESRLRMSAYPLRREFDDTVSHTLRSQENRF
ncbi:uncharacterized protein LOC126108532 isoform X2 [Schistocerca cancellata]|uniref:uncharacterized protein LOC126108532 isoform X2 n=1 Tax=Schistocerca cancellata TaxID=274614 RepID=UPI00211863DB|nr:uncharacterized protein LOC126108532 isoform X2 [Schistocerca cancellata]